MYLIINLNLYNFIKTTKVRMTNFQKSIKYCGDQKTENTSKHHVFVWYARRGLPKELEPREKVDLCY